MKCQQSVLDTTTHSHKNIHKSPTFGKSILHFLKSAQTQNKYFHSLQVAFSKYKLKKVHKGKAEMRRVSEEKQRPMQTPVTMVKLQLCFWLPVKGPSLRLPGTELTGNQEAVMVAVINHGPFIANVSLNHTANQAFATTSKL